MYYFVSSEQIHANFLAAVNHIFNPIEEADPLPDEVLKHLMPSGWVDERPSKETIDANIWQPVIWQVELLEIEPDDLKQNITLVPSDKKFKVLSGPCVGQVSFDNGEDIFDNLEDALNRANEWIDKRMKMLDNSIQVKYI